MLRKQNIFFDFRKTLKKRVDIVIEEDSRKKLNNYISKLSPDLIFLISDKIVDQIYGREIRKTLSKVCPVHTLIHEPSEASKNLRIIQSFCDEITRLGGNSNSCICSLGGGVTGSIAGLISFLVFRGMKLAHVPTTLLAQLDSAPDVKNAVNTKFIKNAVGSYKAPDLVVIDPIFLKTLNRREIGSGLAEAVKHGFAQDVNFLGYIVKVSSEKKTPNMPSLKKIILKTISLKINHWKNTPTMWNNKMKIERLTHLGHTVGKILEIIDIGYLTHGEAISHGMLIEFEISKKMGFLRKSSIEEAKEIFKKLDLLYPLSKKHTLKNILEKLYPPNSEKNRPLFALLKEFGSSKTVSTTVPKKIADKAIRDYLKSLKL